MKHGVPAALRVALWGSAAAGIFIAFAWPFAVSPDPASDVLRWVGTSVALCFLVSLAAAAWITAARGDRPEG